MGKYAPLTRYLREQEKSAITLGFAEVEEILGFSLPGSAYKYPAWWSNSSKGQSQTGAWREAGWETSDVDIRGRKVTFRRKAGEPVAPATKAAPAEKAAPAASSPAPRGSASAGSATARSSGGMGRGAAAKPARGIDISALPPRQRRLLESRARRHGAAPEQEALAIIDEALRAEHARLIEELAEMRAGTQRAGAFDLMDVLGRRKRP